MPDWIHEKDFKNTEYAQLNKKLGGKNYFGPFDRSKMQPGSEIVKDPLHGHHGIIKDKNGNPVGKVDLVFEASFRANAGVKDIVGRGLIYNDNIALIELVKNSKDASSPSVSIFFNNFSNNNDLNGSEIIIVDSGVGMTQKDIISKWLNIAYSEKKGKFSINRAFAGNKGVGRFSCDRLGKKLILYSKAIDSEYIKLPIEWEEFENKGEDDEISKIMLRGEILNKETFHSEIGDPEEEFEHGTVLKIERLRSKWTVQKLKGLITELEKFSPSLDEDFEVYIYSDIVHSDPVLAEKLNKKVDNGILNKISFKTTYIQSEIDELGEFLTTTLFFQGKKIYHYIATNPYEHLKNIKIEIHHLDTISKSYFTRTIGVNANAYGSIFLFYNGFRISPYGNEKNDWLGLDQRKSQGTARYLGTRDIFGRIDVLDQHDSFSVITSREGLAHNAAFDNLVAYDHNEKTTLVGGKKDYGFVTIIIRQLEHFVVGGLDWNRLIDKLGKRKVISADDARKDPNRYTLKTFSKKSINTVTERILKSNLDLTHFEIDHGVIEEIAAINERKYQSFVSDFVQKTKSKSISDLSPSEKGSVRKIVERERAKTEAALEELDLTEQEIEKTEKELTIEKEKNLYLLSTRKALSEDAEGLLHTIKINSEEIRLGIDLLIDEIECNEFSSNDVIATLGNLKLYALRTLKMTELATRSNYTRDIEISSVDIVRYILEYIEVYKSTFGNDDLVFEVIGEEHSLIRSISVLNLSIVLDNLISNSNKWGAKRIRLKFSRTKEFRLTIDFIDNGKGLSGKFEGDPSVIFDLGVRDEPPEDLGGSGIGLYYSRKLLHEMDADIRYINSDSDLGGATFRIFFK